ALFTPDCPMGFGRATAKWTSQGRAGNHKPWKEKMRINETHMLSIDKVFTAALLSLGLVALLSSSVIAGETPREKLNINPV
ncbi:MAG: hypothetical protein WCK89_07765, partial [bacterium]